MPLFRFVSDSIYTKTEKKGRTDSRTRQGNAHPLAEQEGEQDTLSHDLGKLPIPTRSCQV